MIARVRGAGGVLRVAWLALTVTASLGCHWFLGLEDKSFSEPIDDIELDSADGDPHSAADAAEPRDAAQPDAAASSDASLPADAGSMDASTDPESPVDRCQVGNCCIDGLDVPNNAPSPGNPCEACDPERSRDAYSPLSSVACGESCLCVDGAPTEQACRDRQDNDADGRFDCEDANCDGVLCRDAADSIRPSRDLRVVQTAAGDSERDGLESVALGTGMGGRTIARIEFDNLPPTGELDILSAMLHVHLSHDGVVRVVGGVGAPLETAEPGARVYSFSVTDIVREWVKEGSTVPRRFDISSNVGTQATVRLGEHPESGANYPSLFLFYRASCYAGACFSPDAPQREQADAGSAL
jgi:hypothetical protein